MTPPRSFESRMSVIEAKVASMEERQTSNHRENRDSIHGLKDGQQTMINQNSIIQEDVTVLKTKMEAVVGSPHGRPGALDEIKADVKSMGAELSAAVRDATKKDWLYEFGKVLVMALAAAIAAHYGKSI